MNKLNTRWCSSNLQSAKYRSYCTDAALLSESDSDILSDKLLCWNQKSKESATNDANDKQDGATSSLKKMLKPFRSGGGGGGGGGWMGGELMGRPNPPWIYLKI